jgi:hypothetical protein
MAGEGRPSVPCFWRCLTVEALARMAYFAASSRVSTNTPRLSSSAA